MSLCLVSALALALIPWTALSHGIGSDAAAIEQARRQAQQTRADQSRLPAASEQQEVAAWDQNKPCEHPIGREEADLCQQWRMAQATEELRTTADAQFWATIAEAGLLAVTVVFTAIAAIAAVIAARAAQASVNVASEIGQRQLRAYVSVTKVEATVRAIGDRIEIAMLIVLTNAGQTPAYLMRLDIEMGTGPDGVGGRTADLDISSREIGPGTAMEHRDYSWMSPNPFQLSNVGPRTAGTITAIIRFEYRDYLGQEWRKGARFSGLALFDRDFNTDPVTITLNQRGIAESENVWGDRLWDG
jgi:hypothetical protein